MADFISLDGKMVKDLVLQDGIEDIENEMRTRHILGLYADFDESTFTRLFAAKGLTAGSDFDAFGMYGGRRLCNVADDGTITAWYGDENYTETGYTLDPQTQQTIQVQVMVRQPKFWYKVEPIELEEITSDDPTQTGVHGYSGVRMKYYIADRPIPGFKVHPAFFNAQGQEVDCYYIGAYEACLYDVSESEYRLYDSWNVTYDSETGTYTVVSTSAYPASTSDKLSSIAGAKPASGQSSSAFIRANVSTMARNRGTGWDSLNIKIVSAEQLLMAIEYASFNSQANIGSGVCAYSEGTTNISAFTGSAYNLGNGTGAAETTAQLISNGTLNEYTEDRYVSIKYRGVENFWGNILNVVSGINVWGNGSMDGGEAYICDDFAYTEQKNTGNYKPVSFTLPYDNGNDYIQYFGYSTTYDWLFMPSKMGGNTSVPVGDSLYTTNKVNDYRTPYLGGRWNGSSRVGAYVWNINVGTNYYRRMCGARLVKV